jgi:hypothetical protein
VVDFLGVTARILSSSEPLAVITYLDRVDSILGAPIATRVAEPILA